MRKFKITVFLSLVLIGIGNEASAQTVQGCVVPGSNTIYKNKVSGLVTDLINGLLGGAPLYTASPNERLTNANCFYKPYGATSTCKVCPTALTYNFLGLITGCSTTMLTGQEGVYVVECDLDDYSFVLLSVIGVFGIRFIKKRA